MNQMTMLFVQTNLGLPPQALYAALVAGLVGVGVGVLLAWLIGKFYPSRDERAAKSKSNPKTHVHSRVKTWPVRAGDAEEAAGDDTAASTPPALPTVALEELRATSRKVGSLLDENVKALTKKMDKFDPLLDEGRSREQNFQAAMSEGFAGLREELSKVNQSMLGLPALVQEAVGRHFQEERRRSEESQRQKEEQLRQAREEDERRRRDEAERQSRELRDGFMRRLEDLGRSDLMRASMLTVQIAKGLKQVSPEPRGLEDLLPPYVRFIQAMQDALSELNQPNLFAGGDLDGAAKRIEAKFEEIEAAREDLEGKHQPAWLVDLLEQARGHRHLESCVQHLKELLDLEDVPVSVGTELEARHMDDVQVVEAKGYGKRTIVSEVLGNGYRVKETGTVIRKPQVVVNLEG
jgi:hypothetical protein